MGYGTCPQVPYSAVGKMRLLHMTPLKSKKVYDEEWNAHNSVKLHGTDTYQEVCEVRKNNKELMVAQVLGKGSWKCAVCVLCWRLGTVCVHGREREWDILKKGKERAKSCENGYGGQKAKRLGWLGQSVWECWHARADSDLALKA